MSTVDRRHGATPVGDAEASGAVVRVRATDRRRIFENHDPTDDIATAPDEHPAPAHALSASGRAGQAVDEALAALVIARDTLAPIRATWSDVKSALERRPEHEVERWMGIRNGAIRALKPRTPTDVEAGRTAVQSARQAEDGPEWERALDRADSLLQKDTAALWRLTADAQKAGWIAERGATTEHLVDQLPAESPLGLAVPAGWVAPLLPLTAPWLVERLLENPDADERGIERLRGGAGEMWPADLRFALWELAGRLELSAPEPSDEDGWETAALASLRRLITSPESALEYAISRPAEPATYLRAAQIAMQTAQPHMAARYAHAATLAQSEHRRALESLAESRAARVRHVSVLLRVVDDAGVGFIVRRAGANSTWEVRWKSAARWPDTADVGVLELEDELVAALHRSGYDTVGSVRQADPQTLFLLTGVGRAGLRQLRSALAEEAN